MDQILVIDDDDAVLQWVSKMLGHLGYEVMVAHNGEEGIELLKSGCPLKAVITDIRMPKKNGNEVAKYIRNCHHRKGTPIVAITGFVDEVERDLFNGILEKPFKINELTHMIKACC